MGLRNAIDNLRERVRRDGLGAALHQVECRLLGGLGQFQILKGMTARVQDVRDPALFDAGALQARFVEAGELRALAADPASQITPEFLRDAFARGDRCYALFDGAALAAYGWYAERATPLDEHFTLHFGRGWTYMFKGYTLPAWRGKRLHAIGMCRALRALTDEGRHGLISCVASDNFASLHSVTRMGYRIFGQATLLRIGAVAATWASAGCAAYGFLVEAHQAGRDAAAAPGLSQR